MNAAWRALADWNGLDTAIVATAALSSAACAIPGTILVLRRQSLLGDALSHATLPGIVLAWLTWGLLREAGWLSPEGAVAVRASVLFVGAVGSALLCALLTQFFTKFVAMEASAAIGLSYTMLFAFGLLLIRLMADQAHLDAGAVLYGHLELVVTETWGGTSIPVAAVMAAGLLAFNSVLACATLRMLRLASFDPQFAKTAGLPVVRIDLALACVTAVTIVTAFESVGSILVVAMLVTPAATARLLTDRFGLVMVGSVVIAALSAPLGHALAIMLPAILWPLPPRPSASTAGMIAVASGGLFLLALLASPRHGIWRDVWNRFRLRVRIAAEDWLGSLYRVEESVRMGTLSPTVGAPSRVPFVDWLARRSLRRRGWIEDQAGVPRLTAEGRKRAIELVRSHRLWENYLTQELAIPASHVHESAARVEHFIDTPLAEAIETTLVQRDRDPHGRIIPVPEDLDQKPSASANRHSDE